MEDMNILPTDPDASSAANKLGLLNEINKTEFDLSPDESKGKLVITGYGDKGGGKTSGIFLITTGKIGGFPCASTKAISFDNKTKTTKDQWFPEENIKVYEGKRYYRDNPDDAPLSGMKSFIYLTKLIQSWKNDQPDWIVFDGFTIMTRILESAMRFRNGLKLTEGFSNRALWKDRTAMIRDLHNLACRTAKYGVAYVTYSWKELVDEGTTTAKEDVPAYIDVIMEETDVVLHMTKTKGTNENDIFWMRVDSTKYKQYPGLDGKSLPTCDTTLKQGRLLNITVKPEDQKLNLEPIKDPNVGTVKTSAPPVTAVSPPTIGVHEVQKNSVTAAPEIKSLETTAKPQGNVFEIPDISNL